MGVRVGTLRGIHVKMALVWGGLLPVETMSLRGQGFGIWNPGGADRDLRRHGGLRRGRCGPMKTGLDDRGHCR